MNHTWMIAVLSVMACGLVGCDDSKNESSSLEPELSIVAEDVDIPWRTLESQGLDWGVQWRPLQWPIPIAEPFDLEVDLAAPPERIEGATVIVDAEMPHHGHGMNLVPLIRKIEGYEGQRWLVEGMMCHMPGRWEFSVDLLKDGRMERTQWTVELD